MVRRTLQSVLCIVLSPLLAAQRNCPAEYSASAVAPDETLFAYRSSMRSDESVNRADSSGSLYGLSVVPFNVAIELTPVDPAAWANATVNSTVTFRAVHDVIQTRGVFHKSSYADVYAGTLIEGKVTRIRVGKLRVRGGTTEPRVKEVLVGKRIKLELESSPAAHSRFGGIAKSLAVWPAHTVTAVGEGLLFVTLFPILCHSGCDL